MNGKNDRNNPTTRKKSPLFPIPSLWRRARRPGRYENSLATFQRLHSEPVHAEAYDERGNVIVWR